VIWAVNSYYCSLITDIQDVEAQIVKNKFGPYACFCPDFLTAASGDGIFPFQAVGTAACHG
jgi:hypothetical protein